VLCKLSEHRKSAARGKATTSNPNALKRSIVPARTDSSVRPERGGHHFIGRFIYGGAEGSVHGAEPEVIDLPSQLAKGF
jgi:hypothetical protein